MTGTDYERRLPGMIGTQGREKQGGGPRGLNPQPLERKGGKEPGNVGYPQPVSQRDNDRDRNDLEKAGKLMNFNVERYEVVR